MSDEYPIAVASLPPITARLPLIAHRFIRMLSQPLCSALLRIVTSTLDHPANGGRQVKQLTPKRAAGATRAKVAPIRRVGETGGRDALVGEPAGHHDRQPGDAFVGRAREMLLSRFLARVPCWQ
jgi:hypothetical protein